MKKIINWWHEFLHELSTPVHKQMPKSMVRYMDSQGQPLRSYVIEDDFQKSSEETQNFIVYVAMRRAIFPVDNRPLIPLQEIYSLNIGNLVLTREEILHCVQAHAWKRNDQLAEEQEEKAGDLLPSPGQDGTGLDHEVEQIEYIVGELSKPCLASNLKPGLFAYVGEDRWVACEGFSEQEGLPRKKKFILPEIR